jgi:hypothetical protein
MELTNKRTVCEVTNNNGTYTLNGSLTIQSDNRISDLYGIILDNTGNQLGQFGYSEQSTDSVSRSVSNFSPTIIDAINTFITATIAAIKTEISK